MNLNDNRETYTGYQGSPVWHAIYAENCDCTDGVDSLREESEQTCSEATLLYQMMSGLHSSINTHISAGFEDPFTRKFITNTTYFYGRVGEHEDRVKNLYMIYAAVLKSVSLLESAYSK